MFGAKKKNILQSGIDIGTSFIKFAQLSGTRESPTLVNYDIVKVEKGHTKSYIEALTNMAKKFSIKEVSISIARPSVIIRYIELPRMTPNELKTSIRFEAEKYLLFDVNETILDSQILQNIVPGKIKVLLAAAKKEAVKMRLEMLQKAGLSAHVIDCDAFALTNAFLLNFPAISEKANTALINLGERLTIINIIKNNIACFTREIEVGGWDLTKTLAEKLNIDTNASFDLIKNPKKRSGEIADLLESVITHMIEEIKLSLNYYENQEGSVADSIYLSGGVSNFKGLADIFTKKLEIPCKTWDPLKAVKIGKDVPAEFLEEAKGQMHIAVGLALR